MEKIITFFKNNMFGRLRRGPSLVQLIDQEVERIFADARYWMTVMNQGDRTSVNKWINQGLEERTEVIEYRQTEHKLHAAVKKIDLIRTYRQRYPDKKFLPLSTLLDLSAEHNLSCGALNFPFLGYIPDQSLEQINDFKPLPEDTWYSNFPCNIIDFNTSSECIRRSIVGIKADGDITPGPIACSLFKMPLFMVSRNKTLVSAERLETLPDEREAVILHPVPDGFIVVAGWRN